MLKKLLGLPLRAVRSVLGRKPAAPVTPPPPPPRPVARPRPVEAPAHEHTHSHGHSHDHGHDHGYEAKAQADVQIDVVDTPNPNARKFTVSSTVVEKGSMSFQNAQEASGHPLARAIFAVGGVRGVFAVKDFVTVTKEEAADWGALTPKLMDAIREGMAER